MTIDPSLIITGVSTQREREGGEKGHLDAPNYKEGSHASKDGGGTTGSRYDGTVRKVRRASMREEEEVRLDLYNYDLPQHTSRSHILTSPRSLQACRRLGIRVRNYVSVSKPVTC